jgi:formylmethanofuran dehydrogenase subunit E
MHEYVKDNYDLFKEHDRKSEQRIKRLPVCSYCKEPIQDESYHRVEDSNICDCCLKGMKVETEEW